MGYVLEFRDESDYADVVEKMHKAKKAVCEAYEALEESGSDFNERRGGRMSYRNGMSYRGRGAMGYRGDEDWREDDQMSMRRGRYNY